MTLPSSPPIAASQIRDELGLSEFKMSRVNERSLAGKLSGGYSFREFLGKSALRPVAWTGPPTQTVGGSTALSAGFAVRADGRVTWYWTRPGDSADGLVGYWTTPPVFENDGIQVRATIESGGSINGTTGTWVGLNAPNTALSISKTTGSPTTLLIEIRRNGGDVLTSWRITLAVEEIRPISWSGARPFTVGGSSYEATNLAFSTDGNVVWSVSGRGTSESGVAGRWTEYPPESPPTGVQIKATVVSGTGISHDWRSLPLSIGVNPSTSSSVTWKIEMRQGTGAVRDTFNVTLRKS